VSELPSRSAVLPAEFEVLELGLLITLLESEEREEGALGYRWRRRQTESANTLQGPDPL
jgi:hypothetical protein